jgi:signal transduction histidine kinase
MPPALAWAAGESTTVIWLPRFRHAAAPPPVGKGTDRSHASLGPATGSDYHFWQNARAIAQARLLLALGNALVVYLDPKLPTSREWLVLLGTYGNVSLFILYSFWVLRVEGSHKPPPWLPRLATWLDVLFSASLMAITGANKSPFFMWNVFTLVAAALKSDRRTIVRVCLAEIALYVGICLPHLGQPGFVLSGFLVRTSYLFVIALILALMGQRLLEQNRVLARLQRAATHLSAGRTTADILGRIADSLTDLLEVEQVAVAASDSEARGVRPRLVNLDREQGGALLQFAREQASAADSPTQPYTLLSNDADRDLRFATGAPALAGVHSLLLTHLPGSSGSPGVLVACNREGNRGFTAADRELAELLAAQAGPLLETARLQEQRRYHAGVDERRRIAGELHDRLIQTLAGMDLRILACEETWREQRWEPLGEELRILKRLAEEALEEARGAISELAPVRLREEGLGVYLEDCLRKFQERVPAQVEATLALADAEVPEPTALLLIGLLREGLNNIRKHARAGCVTLTITQHNDQIRFRLADDGVGFAPEKGPLLHAPTRQYGLSYLRERITTMGGELRVTSHPGVGTTLEADVPILTEERLVALLS